MSIISRLFPKEDGLTPGAPRVAGAGDSSRPISGAGGAAPVPAAALDVAVTTPTPRQEGSGFIDLPTPVGETSGTALKKRPPPPPRPRRRFEESTPGAIDAAFDRITESPGPARASAAGHIGEGEAAKLFEELAVGHALPLRGFMMEVRAGQVATGSAAAALATARSLITMATEVGLPDLVAALEAFVGAVNPGPKKQAIDLAAVRVAHVALAGRWPSIFEVEGEQSRREAVIVRGLLAQVSDLGGVEIDRLATAGLMNLTLLAAANADELAAVAGLSPAIAAALVKVVSELRAQSGTLVSNLDPVRAVADVSAKLASFEAAHDRFEKAAAAWDRTAPGRKIAARREREQAYGMLMVSLARRGDLNLVARLEPLSFGGRLGEMRAFVARVRADVRESGRSAQDSVKVSDNTQVTQAPQAPKGGKNDGRTHS